MITRKRLIEVSCDLCNEKETIESSEDDSQGVGFSGKWITVAFNSFGVQNDFCSSKCVKDFIDKEAEQKNE